ncbi:MAG: hypothetical protein GY865_08675 [candidate division Zixibacteria bacterium]|nr:hypothetical protein [candidate division Zixibacteria bacterium]
MAQKNGFTFENIKIMLILPASLAVLSPIVALYSVNVGMKFSDSFEREKSILNIKWFHWIWILPFYLSKAIAVPLFCLIFLWEVDFLYDKSDRYLSIFDLISNWGYYLTRGVILFIFIILSASVSHVYSLLTEEGESNKIKTGSIVFGHVLLFSVIHALLFWKQSE